MKDKGGGGTLCQFTASSYTYLLYKNGTILTTITSTKSIHKGNVATATIKAKIISTFFACYIQRVRYLRF